MTPVPDPTPPGQRAGLSLPQAIGWACLGLAIIDVIAASLDVPWPARGWRIRLFHHFYAVGHVVAVGLAAGGAVKAWRRWGIRRRAAWLVPLALVSIGIGLVTLGDDLVGVSFRMRGPLPRLTRLTLLIVGVAMSQPLIAAVGMVLARPWLRWVGVLIGAALAAASYRVLRNDYPAAHLYGTAAGVVLAATSLAGAVPPGWWRWRRTAGVVLGAAGALWAAVAVVSWPRNAVVFELLKDNGAVLVPFLARLRARALDSPGPEAPELGPWYVARSKAPEVPASAPSLLPEGALVLWISIDAVRADLIAGEEHAAALPALAQLRRESVRFTRARAPGSQTVHSLSTAFSGTYFSQQYWSVKPGNSVIWPWDEQTVRFPELLARAGIPTVTFAATEWLTNDWGVVRGFTEEKWIRSSKRFTDASDLFDAAIDRVARQDEHPMFMFMHLLDPHAPYDRGGSGGTAFSRYVAEVGIVDKQIGRLRRALEESGAWNRTVMIVTADHGEAFGEHGTYAHATTLYDVLLRVPLLVRIPNVRPRAVGVPVSLVDLGPTILDLMGVATPGSFMGQSLVPFLRGSYTELDRPIAAEGRRKRALLLPDGYKVIVDDRTGTVEVYDVTHDPGELVNVYDEDQPEEQARLARLRTFFGVHRIRRPGYSLPYRP